MRVTAQLHPQLSIWSAMALCLDICSHVSLVSPTWRQDNCCGPLPPIVWQYRQFVCLLSAGEPSQFSAPAHNDLPSHVTSSIVLHRHSRFSDSVSKHSYFPVHTRASATWLSFSYCIRGPSSNKLTYVKNQLMMRRPAFCSDVLLLHLKSVVIAVYKSQEFLLNVRRFSIYFFDDDARDSTSTTSRCFVDDVVHYTYTILLWCLLRFTSHLQDSHNYT